MIAMIDFIFAILTAFIWAMSVVLVRKNLGASNFISVSLIVTIVGIIILMPLALLLAPPEPINLYGILLFLLAGLLHPGLVRLLYFRGIEKIGASVNASIYASYPIFSSLIAAILLGEKLTLGLWLGIICVVCGAIIIQMAIYGGDVKVRGGVREVIYPFLAAIIASFSYIIKRQGLSIYGAPIVGTAIGYAASFLLYIFTFPIIFRGLKLLEKRSFKLFWKPSIGFCTGHLLSLFALKYGNVSTVTPLIQTESLFIFFLIRYYLRGIEEISSKLIIGATSIIFGVTLITII